jgi:ATP-binding cassette subfamily C protein
MSSVRAFVRLLRDAPASRVVLLLAMMVLVGITEGIGILLLVPLLEVLQHHGGGNSSPVAHMLLTTMGRVGLSPSAGGLLLAFVVLVLVRNAIQHGRSVLGANLQYSLVDRLRYRCFSAVLGAQWRWIVAGRKSDHASLLLTDVSRVGLGLNFGLNLLANMATMLAYLTSAFVLSWTMSLLAVASGGVVLMALAGQRRDALRLGQRLGEANRVLHGNVQESLAGIKLAKILGNEGRHLDVFTQVTGRLREEQLKFQINTSRVRAVYQALGAALLAGYLYVGLNVLHTAVAELLTLVLVFGRLIPMFSSTQQQYHQWLYNLPALQEIDRLLAECKAAAEPDDVGDRAPWPVTEAVCLERVSVRYAERDHPALDALSLCFPARTTTAVMGASGAGKSTLADVLMGLLIPDAGVLRVDGMAVEGSACRRWRHSVAYVPQEVFLFHDSIRNNLLWGAPDASEADLRLALERAAADFVFRLPQGLDTVVGDGGIRLSGGERQRLALARALLKRPSLLILDEATSALDLENEARVREAIEKLHGDLTVVVIGHRLPTLEHADQVIVLDAGRVAAQGDWAEIMADKDAA